MCGAGPSAGGLAPSPARQTGRHPLVGVQPSHVRSPVGGCDDKEVLAVEWCRYLECQLSRLSGVPIAVDLARGIDTLAPCPAVVRPLQREVEVGFGIREAEGEEVVAEPTGAAAPAAALTRRVDLAGRSAVAVISGGNVDPAVLADCLRAGSA